jgi:hypothetical protein
MKSCHKTYKAEVFPAPHVYGVDAISREEARKIIEQIYPSGEYKIVISTIHSRARRSVKGIVNKLKIDELIK